MHHDRRTDGTGRVVLGVDQGREHAAKFEVQTMKALFALLGLFALAGCEDTPATGGHTASRTIVTRPNPISRFTQVHKIIGRGRRM